ncbi:hypothetical protein [Planktotalea sp.]|uniref:hypothetical protein n=1 Tax=Planktotalea sp. TaxID=2029877 RepID=UPI003D6B7E92
MDLLFRRSQGRTAFGRPRFDLHAKLDITQEERDLIEKYKFTNTILIDVPEPELKRFCILIGFVVFLIAIPIIAFNLWSAIGLGWIGVLVVAAILGIAAGFTYYHQKRETIKVVDLMLGRYFHCPSICELVRKESFLLNISQYLRQVMESAKHWDGVDRNEIYPLTPEEAKAVIHSGPLF